MIDIDKLKQGDYITPNELERHFNLPKDNVEYSHKTMKLADQISKRLTELNDTEIIAVQHKYGIRILTDSEATEHLHKKEGSYIRRFNSTVNKHSRLGLNDMTDEEIKLHRKRLEKALNVKHALQRATRKEEFWKD